jgi:hypothetical protein
MSVASQSRTVIVEFPALPNEHGGDSLWLASWLHKDGSEGDWFYSGRGGEAVSAEPPPGAGIRVRRWVSDGLPPEYADVPVSLGHLSAAALDFDAAGPHERLSSLVRPH